MTKITVTEHFTQKFDFNEVPKNEKVKLICKMLNTEKVLDLFQKYINSAKGETTSRALFENNSVGTDGIITFTITLLPFKKKPDKFDVNGIGNYNIFNNENDEIYFSSTIHFTSCKNCNDINELIDNDNFSLEITFTQIAINQFNYENEEGTKYRHVPTEDIEIHINLIKQKEYGEKCFSINYGTKEEPYKHPVYFEGYPIGDISITPPKNIGSRIIDLKNIKALVRRYKKIK